MMNRMQEWLTRAAAELGIRIMVGYEVQFPDGSEFLTQALLPELGGGLGTIVLDFSDEIDGSTRRALVALGFSISTFSAPLPNEEFDIDSYVEMFTEWGWTSNASPKPAWM